MKAWTYYEKNTFTLLFLFLMFSQGLGLLYYGQNYLIYPSAFPPGSRAGLSISSILTHGTDIWAWCIEVAVPSEFGLPYEELILDTPEHVKVRAYLLLQRKDLAQDDAVVHQGTGDKNMSDEDVRHIHSWLYCRMLIFPLQYATSRPTIMMFHGNGGNLGHRIPLAKMFYMELRCNVLMLSYRGYAYSLLFLWGYC